MAIFKPLSQVLGALNKGFAYSTPFAGLSTHEVLGAPALGTNVSVKAAVTLSASVQDITASINAIDVPRALLIKGSAAGMVGTVIIYGTDVNGITIQESIALNGASVVNGVVAFTSVRKIKFPVKTNASGDTVSVGTTAKLGLIHPIKSAGDVKLLKVANTNEAVLAVDVANSTITATSALDGAKIVEVIYLTKLI